jgi:hypothetical protein
MENWALGRRKAKAPPSGLNSKKENGVEHSPHPARGRQRG